MISVDMLFPVQDLYFPISFFFFLVIFVVTVEH